MKTELTKEAIDLYAMYGTPTSVFKQLKDKYGDEGSLSLSTVKKIREKYRHEILSQRKKLEAKIPILSVEERWAYLQQIVDGALEGDEVVTKFGNYIKVDRTSALHALKFAHEITQMRGTLNTEDEELVKAIVNDAYKDLKQESPDKSDSEILAEILETLGDKAKPYVVELESAVASV